MTDKDGAFVLSTYGQGDGAVVGQHLVTVGSSDANKPLAGKSPPNLVLELSREATISRSNWSRSVLTWFRIYRV